uniref:Uncharacterized protein n=1 Tax=Avena sativa TaxID=4498 RepID=A0ACD5ZJQ6_AVESA
MSYSSCSRASRHRNTPFIPCIPCPDCGKIVKRFTSGTAQHNGWVFYKCLKHTKGCNFWHWELEYVIYLLDNNVLTGDDAVDALGWAEDRRFDLKLKQEELDATCPGADEQMMTTVIALVKEVVFILKIVVGLVCLACVLLLVKK